MFNGTIPSDLESILKTDTLKYQYLAGAQDPCLFVKYFLGSEVNFYLNEVERIHPETGELVRGHPKQRQWLRQAIKANEGVLKAGSRSGKTFVTALMHLWFLFYRERPKTSKFYGNYKKRFQALNCAPSLKQAKLVLDEIVKLVNDSPFLTSINFIKNSTGGQQPYIETNFNSIIWGQATVQKGKFILGFYLDVVSLDEAASEYYLEHLRFKILNVRGTEVAGRKFYVSTPQGEGEGAGEGALYFRKIWQEFKERRKKSDRTVILNEMSQFDNPVHNAEVIRANMISMTQAQIREEIYGKFASYGTAFFSPKFIDQCFRLGDDLYPNLKCFFPADDPMTGECIPETVDEGYLPKGGPTDEFFTGLDTAGSTTGDSTVLITLKYTPSTHQLKVCAFERISKTGLFDGGGIMERVKRRLTQFPGHLYYDATGQAGLQVKECLDRELDAELLAYCTPISSVKKPGKNQKFNHKQLMLSNLSQLIEKTRVVVPYDPQDRLKVLKSELKFYKLDDKNLPTDTVMGLALAAYAWKRGSDHFETEIYEEDQGEENLRAWNC